MKDLLLNLKSYFLDPYPQGDTLLVKIGLIVSGIVLILGAIWPFIDRFQRKRAKRLSEATRSLLRSFSMLFRYAGVVWLILFFLRFEGIRPFQHRLWFYGSLLPVLVCATVLVRRYRSVKPDEQRRSVVEDRYHKYLPQTRAKAK